MQNLTDAERNLVLNFRRLPDELRGHVLTVVDQTTEFAIDLSALFVADAASVRNLEASHALFDGSMFRLQQTVDAMKADELHNQYRQYL
jgi:hypothetical protein